MRNIALSLSFLVLTTAFAQAQPPGSLDDHAAKIAALKQSLQALKTAGDAMKVAQADFDIKLAAVLGNKPGPGPTPPPVPPNPTPVDPLAAKLKDAFLADAGTKDQAKKLADLWQGASNMMVQVEADGKTYHYTSTLQIINAVLEVTNNPNWLGPTALPKTRALIGTELADAIGVPSDAALTDAQRSAAAALFGKLATILESL